MKKSIKILNKALRRIVLAQEGGIRDLSIKTGLARESIYKTLSEKGNPETSTFMKIINNLGLELKVVPKGN